MGIIIACRADDPIQAGRALAKKIDRALLIEHAGEAVCGKRADVIVLTAQPSPNESVIAKQDRLHWVQTSVMTALTPDGVLLEFIG